MSRSNDHGAHPCACRLCARWKRKVKAHVPTLATKRDKASDDPVDDALTPADPNDDACRCPDCMAVWGFDVDPVAMTDDGDRWHFDEGAPLADDEQPYCDAP